jgi:(E)-4-hydroxy-3-methylbut-2-enyl-diphosphate synthase
LGADNVPRVVLDFSQIPLENPAVLHRAGYSYSVPLDKWNLSDLACDYIYTGKQIPAFDVPGTLGLIVDFASWDSNRYNHFPLLNSNEYIGANWENSQLKFVTIKLSEMNAGIIAKLQHDPNAVLVVSTENTHAMPEIRRFFVMCMELGIENPIIIKRHYSQPDLSEFQIHAASDLGGLLIDGLGDGIWLSAENDLPSIRNVNQTGFGILQAARVRISKTEYISCPSCGRTLFDLQETTAKIRKRTDHLKGLKIGIMGCIVNGPGEMADADFGYVGTGVGKITLYKGKEVVKRNVPAEQAVDELIELIKDNGKWVEMPI